MAAPNLTEIATTTQRNRGGRKMPLGPMKTKEQKQEGVHQVMHEFKEGDLHSGSKEGPVVKSREQAVAIALSQTGQSKPKAQASHHKGHSMGGPAHSFRSPAGGSDGYGHPAPLRSGSLRNSGHKSAHRLGKR